MGRNIYGESFARKKITEFKGLIYEYGDLNPIYLE